MPPQKEATGSWETRPAEKPGLEFVTHKFDHDHHSDGARERERASVKASKSLNRNLWDKGEKKRQGRFLISLMFFSL